jgi:hypothetical protein
MPHYCCDYGHSADQRQASAIFERLRSLAHELETIVGLGHMLFVGSAWLVEPNKWTPHEFAKRGTGSYTDLRDPPNGQTFRNHGSSSRSVALMTSIDCSFSMATDRSRLQLDYDEEYHPTWDNDVG